MGAGTRRRRLPGKAIPGFLLRRELPPPHFVGGFVPGYLYVQAIRLRVPLAAADDPANSLVHPQEIPDTPADPGTQAGKDNPEKPAEPEKPVTLKPDKPTAKPKKTANPKATAKPKATATPKATARPKKTGGAGKPVQAAANRDGEGRKWEPFSRQYPYRRVRMQPEEGIYAEAAGILIWPVPASPFRKLFDD